MSVKISSISTAFIWRRVHSLTGFWLVLYLIIHLITNSQAALWIGDDGSGFVRLVNSLEALPFLEVVETVLIGIPLAVHAVWGVKRALTAKTNVATSDGSVPSLKYERNRAFTWQRLSSWVLLFGLLGHIVQMKVEAPLETKSPDGKKYLVKLEFDEGLYTLTDRLHVSLFDRSDVQQALEEEPIEGSGSVMAQRAQFQREWMEALASFNLNNNQVIAVASMPGTAFLLVVRDTFKSPLMAILYTIFLLAAAFHACNGLWTFLITWGVILSYRSQRAMIPFSIGGMLLLSFLGLAAIWCSYWINLRN